MDTDFIAYYKDNLAFLRQQSEIFAQQYPKIAKNLGLSAFECADPFVERILEGAAFLAARNEQKLDQGSLNLLQDILSCIAPALGMPHPALLNLQLTQSANAQLKNILAGTQFKTDIKKVSCKFSVLFNTDLCPLTLGRIQQYFQLEDLLKQHFDATCMKSALCVDFALSSSTRMPDNVEIFINLPEHEAGTIAHFLTMHLSAILIQDSQEKLITLQKPETKTQLNSEQWQKIADTSSILHQGAQQGKFQNGVFQQNQAYTNLQSGILQGSSQQNHIDRALQKRTQQALSTLNAAGLSPEVIAKAFYNPAHAASSLEYNADLWSDQDAFTTGQSEPSVNSNDLAAAFAPSSSSNRNHRISADLSILNKSNLLQDVLHISSGMSQLSLYGVYPQLFKYVLLKGLGQAMQKQAATITSGRLIFVFDTLMPKLNINQVFLTNVLPLINLFPKHCSYTPASLRSYYHIVPERTQPDDYEIVKISSIELSGVNHKTISTALPFFSQSLDADQIFFIEQRYERAKGTFIPRTPYAKSECFVALCTANFKPLLRPHLNLVASAWCSNADLPLFMREGTKLSSLDESLAGSQIDLQLNVEPALIKRSNQTSFALLAYFNLHMQPLLSAHTNEQQLRFTLQEMLKAYAASRDEQQMEILSHALIEARPHQVTIRLIEKGVVFFEQGLQIDLYFDPEKSGGSSLFFTARLLCSLIKSCSPLNQNCHVAAYTKQGERLAVC